MGASYSRKMDHNREGEDEFQGEHAGMVFVDQASSIQA